MSEVQAPADGPPPPSGERAEPSLEASAVAVKDAAILLGAQVGTAIAAAEQKLRRVAHEHPYLLLSGGAGSGFVVGGGLAAPITRALVKTGLRTAGLFLLDAAVKAPTTTTTATTTTTTTAAPPDGSTP
jgi:thioesterase domain-containing protein